MRKKKNSKKLRSALAILLAGSMMLGLLPGGVGQVYAADPAPKAAFDETTVVDEETSQGWQEIVSNTTQNIGRIWTDKSVYNNDVTLPGIGEGGKPIPITKPETSDFMVGLSALSSTSNTSVTTSVPLDIVLVLDVSGSMDNYLGTTYEYTATYTINTNGRTTYYALDQTGAYVEVDRVMSGYWWDQRFDHWELNGDTVEPKNGQNDNNPNHIQFYTRRSVYVSKMDGLKNAVNGFIDATAEQNASITDPNKQHHISIVKYAGTKHDSVGDDKYQDGSYRYNYSQIVSNLTDDMSGLKSKVDNLDSAGATSADYGMQHANSVLNPEAGHGVRENTKKVVVMFTDGEPNHSNGFDSNVANEAITEAETLKKKALIYTIGVVSGADPNASIDTSEKDNLNAYLHSVSSNYPTAKGYVQNDGKTEWVMGDREPNSNYYKAATNSEELNNIFQEISQEINSGTGYPTDTEEGFENRDGYITFHDQLGDYMQVDSFNTLVLNDITFSAEPAEAEGKIKYTYSGEVDLNGDGKQESVSDIVIEVTPGAGSTGDTVDVSIPATLLPLRHFKVDVSGNTMTVEDKYPLRLFYNVSLKEEVKNSLANPDQEMKDYIEDNNENGNVYFYSNKFTGSKQGPTVGQTLGDTTATFEPASGNSFYYFTENTPLWLDENMTEAVTAYNADREVYYYEKTYYKLENGAPKEVKEAVSFRSHPQDEVRDWVGTAANNQLYIKAGAPRLTRIHDLTDSKENPIPGTATEVITPNWDNEQNQRFIEVSLGNNGRLGVELPGTLEIKKTVTSEVKAPEKDFTFTLSLTNEKNKELTGEFDAQKFNAQGVESGDPFKVQNHGSVTLKADESVKIYGLSNEDKYHIEEIDLPKGFTAKENPITGKIVGNDTVTAAFANTYAVKPVILEGDLSIRAQKILTGRDWQDTDSFNLVLTATDNAPLPEESDGMTVEGNKAVKKVTNGDVFSFGKITFTKPGTYIYNVAEQIPTADNAIPGISYSGEVYRIEIIVIDEDGSLSAISTVTKVMDEMGQQIDGDGIIIKDKIATFTNKFEAESIEWGARIKKDYTDNSGAKPLEKGSFTFRIETVVNDEYTDKGPLPGGADSYDVTNGITGDISFGQATFDTSHYGKKYLYKITEVVPDGVTADNPTQAGMTYDKTVYYLELSFGSQEVDGKEVMTITPKYMNAEMKEIAEKDVTFKNIYTPTPVVIGEDTTTAIQGSKILNGRGIKEDEFSFELTAGNDVTKEGLKNDSIVFEEDDAKESMTAKTPSAENGSQSVFGFGKIKFTKPGTYTFNMKEVIPEPKAGGMTYDEHTEVVTVTVTDKNGILEAQTTYDNDDAAFVNTYQASHNYIDDGGALVTKTLTGRNMSIGEFNFTIEGTDDNAEAANQKLAGTDKSFTNYAAKDGAASAMPKLQNVSFTEADAGQTFTYLIKEVIPADEDKAGGVTYDQSEFTLAIAVADDGDGTMSTTTTVTRTKAADGTDIEDEVIGTYTNAEGIVAVPFANAYKAAPVIVDTSDTTAGPRLRKVLRGRDWHEGESFAFTMTPQDGAPIPAADEAAGITVDESGNVHAVVTEPENGAKDGEEVYFGFGKITYDTAGTYVYTVTEDVPDPKAGGMTYSKNVATITVTVTDPGTGNLNATVTVNGNVSGRRFYNDYTASLAHNAAGGIVTTKTLHGHDMADRQFTFQVEALDGTGTTAEENAKRIGIKNGTTGTYRNDGTAKDGETLTMKTADGNDIEFTAEDIDKTFVYQFSEMGADGQFGTGESKDGYTYDTEIYTVELRVTDDGDGTLTLHTKVTNKAGQVTEETSSEVDKKETRLDFTNRYAASGILNGTENLAGTKKMDGPWEATGKDLSGFQFTITGGDKETNTAIGAGIVVLPQNVTVTSDKDGSFNFGDITFNKKGTYKFTVSEVVPADNNKIPGVVYNANPVTITVEVTDNNDGTLTAALAEGSPELTFTNTYATTQDATFTPSVMKKVEGLDAKENFTFKLSAADDATKRAIDDKTITGIGTMADPYSAEKTTTKLISKGETEQVDFNALTFKKAGTYKFTVQETNANAPTGWTYDSHTYEIIIKVTDQDSVLKATQEINADGVTNSQIFTNRFAATTTYDEEGGLNVTKTLNGRTLAADMFEFTITGEATESVTAKEADAKLAEDDKSFKNTAPNGDGTAVMNKLQKVTFDQTDIGKTYQYVVREVAGTDTKYTYDQVSATVAIKVQEKDGELYTVTTVTKGDDSKEYSSAEGKATAIAEFVNSYTPDIVTVEPGTFAGQVTKVLKGNRGTELAAGEFNFQMTITPADETSSMDHVVLPEGASDGTVTAANAANGLVSFGNIQFKAAGNYNVAISEVIPEPADPNMTYDKHTFSYNIAVTYNAAEGTLSAAVVEGSTEGSETFTNIYEADDAKDVANTDDPTTSVNGKVVGVGDQLTYTIDWVNNAVDGTGAPAKAEVTITDMVPAGTKYVSADNKGAYDQDTNTITWTLGEQEVGASGTVSFVVEVLDIAGGTGVTNKAEITVGDNNPKQTNEVTTNVPGKDSVVEGDGELQVGSVLTYTISYKNPEADVATVTITDEIPDGLDYVDGSASNNASYDAETRMLTWTLENVPAGETGTVTFQASVNENAVEKVDNKATIQIGENDPKYETNTDSKPVPKSGALAISKTIALTEGQGTVIDTEKAFEFTVALTDSKDKALTKSYTYTITNKKDEEVSNGEVKHNGTISLKHGETATITGLPAGTKFTVTETAAAGYTTSPESREITGSVTAESTANADFTNTYSVTGNLTGAESLKVTKNFTGREGNQWLESDAFTFTLTAADDEATQNAIGAGLITLPEPAEITIDSNTEGKQAAFGNITFNIAGRFKFNVTEQASGIAGVTDDAKPVREIVVNVVDNKNGTLTAAIADGSDNLIFANTYGAGSGENDIAAQIPATKKLTGRNMKADEFTFEVVTRAVEGVEGFTETVVATGTNAAGADGETAQVTFAGRDANGPKALNYTTKSLNEAVEAGYATKEGNVWTVNYTARELTDNLPEGVTPVADKTEFNFTIVVTDNTDGTLTAEVQTPEGGIVFENAYTAEDTEVNTDPADAKSYFNKVLTGRSWLGTDEFTFTITPWDGAPAPEGAAEDGTKTVTVTSDSAKAGEAVLFGFGKIRFTDEDMNGAAAGQDGTRTKEFRYTVKENPLPDGKMTGVTIDGHEATLKITVSDNLKGKLEVTNIASENGTFTNEYKSQLDYAAAGGLQITKALNGRDMEKDQFTFTVTPKATEGSTTAEEAAEKFGLANAANTYKNEAAEAGAVTTINVLDGKNVTFTQADAGKTFTYEAAETAGTNTAYTYDTDVRTVTVKVKDNNNSTLTVTTRVTKVKDGQEVIVDEQKVTTGEAGQKKATISFVNTYNDEPVELGGEGSVKINATKTLANRPLTDGEFTFRIFDKKGNPVVGKDAEATGTNAADGSITFAPVSYDTDRLMADVKAGIASVDKTSQAPAYVYTYDYTVAEDNPSGGVTGIATTFAIQVIVTDRGDGTLAIEVKYPDGKDSLPFENVYGKSANAEIALNGKKVYEKESVNAPDIAGKYTFTITGTDELGNPAPMPVKDGKVVTETTNDAAGNIDFGKLVYTMENVFGSAESQDEQTNANQDVEAGQDPADTNQNAEAGQDPAAADTAKDKTAAEDAADAAENAASEETAGDGTEGTKAPETDETDIEANGGSNAGSIGEDQDKEAAGAASADGGNVVDQAGTMNAQDAGQANRFSEPRTKVYTYKVTESGSMAGVTNDMAAAEGKTFTVTVTDNGDGTISAVSSWQNDFAFEFTNTYRVNPTDYSVNEHISIKKELTGRDLHEGEFTFELIDESGNVVASAVNEADGTVRFGALHYTEAGTYNYVIREAEGTAGGVQYDSAEHTVTVVVTDNGDGTLSAKAETKSKEDMNGIVFRNIYEARPASVTLGASKTYKGAELKDKQFTFVLKDKDGNVVFEAKNGADGQVMFETLIYDRAGVYEYTISEKNDKQKNVTYDENVYNVTITVTDNGKGSLIAEAAYADGRTPQFVNTYTKPQDPVKPEQPAPTVKPQNPGAVQTGDHNSFAGTLGMAALALAAAAGIMLRRKKRS